MKAFITGHNGFIGKNLPTSLEKQGIQAVYSDGRHVNLKFTKNTELCVYQNDENAWKEVLTDLEVDILIHNGAVVGTDVVGLDPIGATSTNVTGTYSLIRVANSLKIPIVYLGTTVIYDTAEYQKEDILEDSLRGPHTYYGHLKLLGENLIKSYANDWSIIRPLFAFGGIGDMNSLIAKTFYGYFAKKDGIDMFLNPNKVKDYLHVNDFCDAVAIICSQRQHKGDDFNIAAETPVMTKEIVEMMSIIAGEDLNRLIQWHPETDYLGNHRLSSRKFKAMTGWEPKFTLDQGLRDSWNSICHAVQGNPTYNPLRYLEEAKEKNVNLLEFY
jgi:nucleoside-diphosphate-sugar epimerase